MTRVHAPDTPVSLPSTSSTSLHLCTMCGCHFTHLFAYKRHLLRQHWFEAQKQFDESTRVEGLTEKQSQKLHELYRKLKERNSPTPPKRSRRSKPEFSRAPKVANLKEYKLVTVDDMSDAYRDKYHNPGGYTIFHFKVPKKSNQMRSPTLTALKKTYQTSDQKTTPKTEKVPITTTTQLSSWQQKSFQHHLSRGIHHNNMTRGLNSLTTPSHVSQNTALHVGCEKCRKKHGSSRCTRTCSSGWPTTRHSLPLQFLSPLLGTNNFNCTDILKRIINSPESMPKLEISLNAADRETKVDVMNVDLTSVIPQPRTPSQPSPSSTTSSNSPGSSRDHPIEIDFNTPPETMELLAQIGLEMVYSHLFSLT